MVLFYFQKKLKLTLYDRRDAGVMGVENWRLLSSMTVGGDNNKKIKVKNDNS